MSHCVALKGVLHTPDLRANDSISVLEPATPRSVLFFLPRGSGMTNRLLLMHSREGAVVVEKDLNFEKLIPLLLSLQMMISA